jgi:RNA polymerase sigma-70 factor, ECF subfamily
MPPSSPHSPRMSTLGVAEPSLAASAPSDAARTAAGPSATAGDLFRTHGPYVWRALRYLGAPSAEIADLVQEVFVVVHRKIDTFEGRAELRTWIYGICLRVIAAHRRRARVQREDVVAEVPDVGAEAEQDESVERGQNRALLRAALERLSPERRAVFVLYEIEELAMREVAEAVGCPLQTAYSRLYAARQDVEREFQDLLSRRTQHVR